MSELQALLKRIRPPKPKYEKVSPEVSPYLTALLGRMEARQWRDDQLQYTLEFLKESANEIDLIKHLKTCYECRMEAELSIERYGGRGLPWFLDLINDVTESFGDPEVEQDPRLAECPNVENYKIGSYWEDAECAHEGKPKPPRETLDFIEARCKWAEKIIKEQITMAAQHYKKLKNWDLNGPPPQEPQLPF